MKLILEIWFRLSIVLAIFFAGWTLDKAGLFRADIYVFVALLVGVQLGFYWYKKDTTGNSVAPNILQYSYLCTALLIGGTLASEDLFKINKWMDQSFDEVHAKLVGEIIVEGLDTSQYQEGLDEFLSDFEVFDHGIDNPVLVSFDRTGMVLFDGKQAKLLTIPKKHMLSEVLPDNTIVYSQGQGLEHVQTVFKGQIINNELQVEWQRVHPRLYLHHWGDVFENRFYHPGRKFVDLPNPVSKKIGHEYTKCQLADARWDKVQIFDFDTGDHLESIDLVPLIANMESDDVRKMFRGCREPLHLNSVQIVKNEREAGYFPDGKVGDILISMRDVHTIMLLDKDTHEPKWYVVGSRANGKFVRQHSPRITERGTVLLVDNAGSDRPNGITRITEIDIATRELVGFYEATGDEFFQTTLKGKIEILGDRILVLNEFTDKKSNKDSVELFLLDCPTNGYISTDCTRTDIFRGKSNQYNYNNAAILSLD